VKGVEQTMKTARTYRWACLAIAGLLFSGLSATNELDAQLVAPVVRVPARVKHIWSPNKNFVADVLFDGNVTKIGKVDWQGSVGRTTWLWSMAGTSEQGWLSNDGTSFVVGYAKLNLLPPDYKKDQVMLSFYSRGELVRQVRLNELMSDFSKLQHAGTNYRWATYLELNTCSFLTVETVEGKTILFDMDTGKSAEFQAKPDQIRDWKSYRDDMKCYELQYPRNYLIQETRTSGGRPAGQFLLRREKEKEWLIEGLVEDMAEYPREFRAKNFEEFVFERASAMYSADGCDSSISVAEFVNKKRFVTPNHLDALEFYLVLQDDHSDDAGTMKSEKRTVGPVYAISISGRGEFQRVLFLRLSNGQEDKALRETATLKAMAQSVSAFTTLR
jgi:hypothetical protein